MFVGLAADPAVALTAVTAGAQRALLAAAGAGLPSEVKEVAATKIHPTVYHGDFAPWNIKERAGNWTLIDWERGELDGIPVWDWLHFIVQPAVLVEWASPNAILERIEALFVSAPFKQYAARAGVENLERLLAIAYFHHCLYVLRQTEGRQRMEQLAQIASAKWVNPSVRLRNY